VLASATYHTAAGPELKPFRRLRPGCVLLSAYAVQGTVMGLPTALQSIRSLFASAAADASLICTAHAPARAYLLWPALQAPPSWLTDVWVPVRGAEVKVSGWPVQKQRCLQQCAYSVTRSCPGMTSSHTNTLCMYILAHTTQVAPAACCCMKCRPLREPGRASCKIALCHSKPAYLRCGS
jgi:hypothetical protein